MTNKEWERLEGLTRIDRPYWEDPTALQAGMDEVGRGPLAGPVTVGIAVMPASPVVEYVNDSKKLTPARREKVYAEIMRVALAAATCFVGPEIIDEINIRQATRKAFCTAARMTGLDVNFLLVDAEADLELDIPQRAIIHGDALCYSIAAASIVAKVTRDKYMVEMDALYPQYGFARNKGYGTAEHIAAIQTYGPCPIHRRSFITKWA